MGLSNFSGGVENFCGRVERNFRGGGGVIFFGRGDIFWGGRVEIFSGGVGNYSGGRLDIFSRGVAIFLGGVEIFSGGVEIFQKGSDYIRERLRFFSWRGGRGLRNIEGVGKFSRLVFGTELELERAIGRVNYVIVMPIACK